MIYTALIGFPTSHSLSPKLFQVYASEFGIEYAHLKIDVNPEGEKLREVLRALATLNFAGLNVTVPYKLAVIEMLDHIDPFAAKIGAVNTIQIQKGHLFGFNTDYIGARKSIEKARGGPVTVDDKAVIFGTGGAAKACVGALLQSTQKICVLYRDPPSARTQDFRARFSGDLEILPINSSQAIARIEEATVICNATPVGMVPNVDSSVLPASVNFSTTSVSNRVFFDVVYTPLETVFLKQASQAGFITADGLDMMIYQGVEAFRIWTGKTVSEATAAKARQLVIG